MIRGVDASGREIRGGLLAVWSSYLFHFSLLQLLEGQLDFFRFHLRLNFLLNSDEEYDVKLRAE